MKRHQFPELVIGFQRIAAGGDEVQAGVEFCFAQRGIGAGVENFVEEIFAVERPGAGDDTRAWGPPFLPDQNGGETTS